MNLFIEELKMAIYDQLNATMADRDTKAYLDLLHEDFVSVFHKSGNDIFKIRMGRNGYWNDG